VRPKLKPLDEAECYARLHGERDPNVRVVSRTPRVEQPAPARPARPPVARMSGEELRKLFERRLESRDSSGS